MPSTPFDPFKLEFDTDFEEDSDDSGGESGSGSGSMGGFNTEDALWWLDTDLKRKIREGESKFGVTPFTEDPHQRQKNSLDSGERLHGHPLLDSQRFDGIDDFDNPVPSHDPEALARYNEYQLQKRLQKQLANMPQASSAPRFERR